MTLAVTALVLGPEEAARRRSDEDPSAPTGPPSRITETYRASLGGYLPGGVASQKEYIPWSEHSGCSRQCPGPRGQCCEGEQVSMSQRGSAPRPASRRSPRTSPEAVLSSPRSPQASTHAGIRRRDDPQAMGHDSIGTSNVVTDAGGRPSSSGVRSSDVHGILNASESHNRYPGGMVPYSGQPSEVESSRSAMGDQRRPQGNPHFIPYVFQGQQPLATPPAAYSPSAPSSAQGLPTTSAGRRSPTIGPQLPPLGVPRRMITPRSPRVASFSRAARMAEELQQNPLPRQPSLPESASSQDISPRSRPVPLGGQGVRALPQPQPLGRGTALPPLTASPVAARSLSQPTIGHRLPPTVAPEHLQSSNRHPLPVTEPSPYPSQTYLAQDAPAGGPGGETRWTTGGYGSLVGLPWGRGLPAGESQHLLTITPQYGEEFVVPVDTHQGSKTQDQKRQKNAIASARFRTRKKEREHQLEIDNHELAVRVRELEEERDFYRNERNRLRDVVSRTASISDWANGPPSPLPNRRHGNFPAEEANSQGGSDHSMIGSPVRPRRAPQARSPSRTGGSYVAESSHMASAPRLPSHPYAYPPPYPYGPQSPSTGEPPARRRRIQHAPQFTAPSYGALQQTTLPPPMAPSTYGLNPAHHPTTSAGIPRLPPLRIDQPSPPSEYPPQPQPGPGPGAPPPLLPQQPQQSQQQPSYPPAYSRSYEPGWASAPQGPQEGQQQ